MFINGQLIVMIVTLFFVGCTQEQSNRNYALPDGDYKEQTEKGPFYPQTVEAGESYQQMIEKGFQIIEEESTKEVAKTDIDLLFNKIINPLRKKVLDVHFVLDPNNMALRAKSGEFVLKKLTLLFNQAVVLAYFVDPLRVIQSGVLGDFEKLLFWDCDNNLKGSCESFRYLRRADSGNSVRIVKMLHDDIYKSNSKKQLLLIKAAYELKNRAVDQTLRLMLLSRVSQKILKGKHSSAYEAREEAILFSNILKRTINLNDFKVHNKEALNEIFKTLEPWTISRKDDSSLNPAMGDIIRLSQNMVYTDEEKKSLSPGIVEQISTLKTVVKEFEQNIQFQLDNIRGLWYQKSAKVTESENEEAINKADLDLILRAEKSNIPLYKGKSKDIITNLLADVSFEYDEYFFLVYNVFHGHYSLKDGRLFYSIIKKDDKKLIKTINDFVKLHVANGVIYTSHSVSNFYENNSDLPLLSLLEEAEEEAGGVRKMWATYIQKSKELKKLLNSLISDPEQLAYSKTVTESINSVEKNIKFLVTYPNMFPLLQILAEKDLNDSFRGFFGVVTIDSQKIIDRFFNGEFKPIFNFGNDEIAFDQTQIIYAFYQTLITETFPTYSTNKEIDFTLKNFFNTVLKKLIQKNKNSISEARNRIVQLRSKTISKRIGIRLSCQEERQFQEQDKDKSSDDDIKENETPTEIGSFEWESAYLDKIKNEKRRHSLSKISFTNIGKNLYDYTSGQDDKYGKALQNIYSLENRRIVKQIRETFPLRDIVARMLVDVYKIYLKEKGEKMPKDIEKTINLQYNEIEDLKADLFRNLFALYDDVSGCEEFFVRRNKNIRYALILKEKQFLEKLYDSISLNSSLKKEELDIFNYTQDSFFPEDYQKSYGFMEMDIRGQKVISYKMDAFSRSMAYLKELLPNNYQFSSPAVFANESVYKKEGTPKEIFFKTSDNNIQTKKQFVESGIKAFADQVPWIKTNISVIHLETRLKLLNVLYKKGLMAVSYPDDIKEKYAFCSDLEQKGKAGAELLKKHCRKIDPKEVIYQFKNYVEFVSMSQEDEYFMDLLGQETKYLLPVYEDLVKRDGVQEFYGFFDQLLFKIFSDEVAEKSAAGTQVSIKEGGYWFLDSAIKFAEATVKLEATKFIFPYSKEVAKSYKGKYVKHIENQYNRVVDLLEALKKEVPTFETFTFRYFKNKKTKEYNFSESKGFLSEDIFSANMKDRLTTGIKENNEKTNQIFKDILIDKYLKKVEE